MAHTSATEGTERGRRGGMSHGVALNEVWRTHTVVGSRSYSTVGATIILTGCQATALGRRTSSGHAPAVRTSWYYLCLGCGGAGPVAGGPRGTFYFQRDQLRVITPRSCTALLVYKTRAGKGLIVSPGLVMTAESRTRGRQVCHAPMCRTLRLQVPVPSQPPVSGGTERSAQATIISAQQWSVKRHLRRQAASASLIVPDL